MKPHHKEEDNLDYIYYLTGLVCGLFTGAVIEKGFTWIFVGGILGLLTAAFFLNVLARNSEDFS